MSSLEPKFEQPAPLQFPKSDPDALFASLANVEESSDDDLDTSKFYIGSKDLNKAFNEIISTSHGRYIVSVIQNADQILAVSIGEGNGPLGRTIPRIKSVVIEEPEW